MAIIGYEQDQVMVDGAPGANPEKDQSVPIYWAYNHHYVSWVKGKHSTMVQLNESMAMNGHPMHQDAIAIDDPNPDSTIPTSQFFSEGNGGESRKSYHGYPQGNGGLAQLIDSPQSFTITPMQIDTWNRNTSYGDPFVPGPESTASSAPITGPDAIYSGHLECPCTDRITKTITETFATQGNGQCASEVDTAASCFKASAFLGFEPADVRNVTVTSATVPKGCFLEASNGTVTLTFNDFDKARRSVDCGPKAGAPIRLTGRASQYVTMSVDIDASVPAAKQVTITLEGPADVWYGIGLGAQVMKDAPNAIIVSGNGTVFEQKLADQSRGTQLPFSLTVVSNTVVGTCPFPPFGLTGIACVVCPL